MRKLLPSVSALLIVLAVFLITATPGVCQDDDILKVVRSFYACIQKGDMDTLTKIVSPDVAKKFKESDTPDGIGDDLGIYMSVAQGVKDGLLKFNFKDIKLEITSRTADTAKITSNYSVSATIEGKDEEDKGSDILHLRQTGGVWIIEKLVDNISGKDE